MGFSKLAVAAVAGGIITVVVGVGILFMSLSGVIGRMHGKHNSSQAQENSIMKSFTLAADAVR